MQLKIVQNKFLVNSRRYNRLHHEKCIGFTCSHPKRLVGSRAMLIFRCESYIYVRFFRCCELPVASTELLFEEPSLRVILRKQSDFAFLRALRGLEIALFHEIPSSDTSTGAWCKTLTSSNFFHILWIELRLCIQQATTSVAGGKIFTTKTNW